MVLVSPHVATRARCRLCHSATGQFFLLERIPAAPGELVAVRSGRESVSVEPFRGQSNLGVVRPLLFTFHPTRKLIPALLALLALLLTLAPP